MATPRATSLVEEIAPQSHYAPPEHATPRQRLEYLLCNYVNEPFLLNVPHTTKFFEPYPSNTTHFTRTLTLGNDDDDWYFNDVGLQSYQNIHHINITIKTSVRETGPENPGRYFYAHSITGQCCDYDGTVLYMPRDGTPSYLRFSVTIEIGPTQPIMHGEITALYRRLYTWKCVIEYLKHGAAQKLGGVAHSPNPLIGLGLLGDGAHLRRIGEEAPRGVDRVLKVIRFDWESRRT